MAILRTRAKSSSPQKITPSAAQVAQPVIDFPAQPAVQEIVPIAKDSSGAESMLRAYPAEDRSPVAQVIRELAALAMKDQLWVKDFREFGKIIDETNFCGSDALVPLVFGKPDAENVRTGQRRMSPTNLIVDCNLRDLLYYQRVLNPTTGKNENLTICFVDGFFYKAVAESGNHYSR